MAVSVEHRALHHAIDDLRTATTSLQARHGDIPVVARLRNDLERLVLDVADVDALPPGGKPGFTVSPSDPAGHDSTDVYSPPSWDEADDEGVGGFRGGWKSGPTGRKGR